MKFIMVDNNNSIYVLQDLFDSIKERKSESDKELKNGADDYEKGRNIAYFEIIEMLKTRCKIYGVNLHD